MKKIKTDIKSIILIGIVLLTFFILRYKTKLLSESDLINFSAINNILDPNDVILIKGNHWNWISFPRMGRNDNYPVPVGPVLKNIKPMVPSLKMIALTYNPLIAYDICCWSNTNATIIPSSAYKLISYQPGKFVMTLKGKRLSENLKISLNYGLNLVGFWLPGSYDWATALGSYLNDISQIRAENWTLTKVNGAWIGPSSATFDYGKGYELIVDNPNGILGFHWNPSAQMAASFSKPQAENFTYEEKPNYEVIDIESIEGGEDIEEIGAFVNGICVGASKVEDYPVQILAYTEDANKGGDDNTIYFEVVSGKSKHKINDINVYNEKTKTFEKGAITVTGNGYHLITLGKKDYSEHPTQVELSITNYPNPFNPETKISFNLPEVQYITLNIYNIKGQKVRTLLKGRYEKGENSVVWKGRNDAGKKVSSGIYFYELITPNKRISKKMLLLK